MIILPPLLFEILKQSILASSTQPSRSILFTMSEELYGKLEHLVAMFSKFIEANHGGIDK